MEELWPDLAGGLILILSGLLVKRFPMLIAGYNTTPAHRKKNIDIEGLSSFMRRHLLIAGGGWILLAAALYLAGQSGAMLLFYLLLLPGYLLWIVTRSQRYDHNE